MSLLIDKAKKYVLAVLVGIGCFAITAFLILNLDDGSPKQAAAGDEIIEIGEVTPIFSATDIQLPIDKYRPSLEVQNAISHGESLAMKDCMKRFGMEFSLPEAAWDFPAENHDYERLFGLLDQSEAQNQGYHPDEELLANGESAKVPRGLATEDEPNYLAVAMGDDSVGPINGEEIPAGGCIAEARHLIGIDGERQALYEGAINFGLAQSDADPRVRASFDEWSRCMADAGHDYGTPMDAINDPKWATASASAAEINVASADVRCKKLTNLTGIRVVVAASWQARYIEIQAEKFSKILIDLGDQQRRAASLSR